MIKKESLPDRPKFCRSMSAVRHLFWRLHNIRKVWIWTFLVSNQLNQINVWWSAPIYFQIPDIFVDTFVVKACFEVPKKCIACLTHSGLLPEPTFGDSSTTVLSSIHLRAISPEILLNLICNICSEITLLKTPLPREVQGSTLRHTSKPGACRFTNANGCGVTESDFYQFNLLKVVELHVDCCWICRIARIYLSIIFSADYGFRQGQSTCWMGKYWTRWHSSK